MGKKGYLIETSSIKFRSHIAIFLTIIIIDLSIANAASLSNSADSKILNENTERFTSNDIVYLDKTFHNYNNEWYDLISYADIALDSQESLNITSPEFKVSLQPYIKYDNAFLTLRDTNTLIKNQINLRQRYSKDRNYFKFAYNFTKNANITEVGFYYTGMNFTDTTIYNKIVEINFQDLIENNYTVKINGTLVRITNLKDGFNDLDPIFKFMTSATLSGTCWGQENSGVGDGCLTSGNYRPAGYNVGADYELDSRVFFSFNTSALNQTANITDNILWYSVKNKVDSGCGGQQYFDIVSGTFIGESLDASDYNSETYVDSSASLFNAPLNDTNSISNGRINKSGFTDIMFKPNWIHTSGCAEYVNIFINPTQVFLRPYLNVTYTTPPVYNLTYDANGNLIQGFGKYFEYDGFNHLVKVRNSTNNIIVEYFYDPDGNRIKKFEIFNATNNQTTYYIGNFIQVRNISGVFNTTYYYDRDILVGEKRYDGKTYFYHPDHLGSTQLVTDQNGNVVENTSYSPYGELIQDGKSRYLFTGKELDRETNFEYYGARYYYPWLARFVQPDLMIQNYYNPQSLNRYSYVLNNPYKYVDPSGNSPIVATTVGGFILGAGLNIYYQYEKTGSWQNINLESAAKSGLVGAVGVTTALLTGGGSVVAGGGAASTLLPAIYSTIASNAAAFALYGEDYLNYLSEDSHTNELDKGGIIPGYDLPGIDIMEKNVDKKGNKEPVIKDLKKLLDENKINQQYQISQNDNQKRNSGSGGYAYGAGYSYLVTNPDGAKIWRTSYDDGTHRDQPKK